MKDDIDLKFLAKLPVPIERIGNFYVPTLKEIAEVGDSVYRQIISCFLTDTEAIKGIELGVDIGELNDYKAILVYYIMSDQFRDLFSKGMRLFFHEEVNISNEHGLFYLGKIVDGKFIDEEKMKEIKKLVMKSNHLSESKQENDYNPANDAAREFLRKKEEAMKKFPKKKDSHLFHYISSLAWKSNSINILNVFDMNIYQLYDSFPYIDRIDNYHFTMTGVYTGNISSKDIKMSDIHWTSQKN